MFKRTVSLMTLAAFLFYSFAVSGCATRKTVIVPIGEIKRDTSGQVLNGGGAVKGQIRRVYTSEGSYFFNHYARIDATSNAVIGYAENQGMVNVPLEITDSLSVERTYASTKNILITVGVFAVLAVTLALTAEYIPVSFHPK
ncbi:MAG: hypothetical protein JSV52_06650 [Candidatus Zixiibacteriota bacterium]|nr:MAG: hypothetical protein JSV52_06650 [candidate division Zixibacteria bacterium]